MKWYTKLSIRVGRLLPANFPTNLAEAFDQAKRSFWKAAAPTELAKEKIYKTYLKRELQDCYDRIEELEAIEPGTREATMNDTIQLYRKRIDQMQIQMGDLEEENRLLRERLGLEVPEK